MKFKRSILGVACTGVAAVTPLVMPLSASALTDATVVFSGTSNDTVLLVGGGGGFTFGSGAGCIANGIINNLPAVNAPCSITAAGTFINVVCGTGLAGGVATVTAPQGAITVGFVIIFVGDVGVLLPGGTPIPTSGPGPLPYVGGVVVITPNSLQTDGTRCTFGFTVNGGFIVFNR